MFRIRIQIQISQRHGSADPDPHQNVMDPEHWKIHFKIVTCGLAELNGCVIEAGPAKNPFTDNANLRNYCKEKKLFKA